MALLPVAEALERLLGSISSLPAERVALEDAVTGAEQAATDAEAALADAQLAEEDALLSASNGRTLSEPAREYLREQLGL